MNFQIGFNLGSTGLLNVKDRFGHQLTLMSGRNASCDNCRKIGLFQSYACLSCNFDLCETCAANNQSSNSGFNSGFNTGFQTNTINTGFTNINAVCRYNHPLVLATGRNSSCDYCKRFGLSASYACFQCNFDLCEGCAKTNQVNINTGFNSGFNSGFSSNSSGFNSNTNYNNQNTNFNTSYNNQNTNFNPNTNYYNQNTNFNSNMNTGFNTNFNSGMNMNTGYNMTTSTNSFSVVPTNKNVKLYDRNHNTFVFVGNGKQDNDHTVYSCPQNNFQGQNFQPRTNLLFLPTNDGCYQIMDQDHQAFFFVGNSKDTGGDHTVYASPQKFWSDYNNFIQRTAFSFVPAEYGCYRILDKNHSSYVFVGNSTDAGDHTLYSVPISKYNSNPNEWMRRTLFEIKF